MNSLKSLSYIPPIPDQVDQVKTLDELPDELIAKIASHLPDLQSIRHFGQTCRKIYSALHNKSNITLIWKGLIANNISPHCSSSKDPRDRFLRFLKGEFIFDKTTNIGGDLLDRNKTEGANNGIVAIVTPSGGKYLYAASYGGEFKVWDTKNNSCIDATTEYEEGLTTTLSSILALSPDGKYLYSGSTKYYGYTTIKMWDTETMSCLDSFGEKGTTDALVLSPDGKYLYSASGDDFGINVWDTESRSYITTFKNYDHPVIALTFSPDGQYLYSGSLSPVIPVIKVWDTKTHGVIANLAFPIPPREIYASAHYALVTSFDGKYLYSGSFRLITVWNTKTHDLVTTLKGHRGDVIGLALSPDGNQLISRCRERLIGIWDLHSLPK